MHMKLFSILLVFISSYANADVIFENCEPKLCESLIEKLSEGIPIFVSQINTGESFKIAHSNIASITQKGNEFKVGVVARINGRKIYHHVSYKCFSKMPCLFVSTGGVTSVLEN